MAAETLAPRLDQTGTVIATDQVAPRTHVVRVRLPQPLDIAPAQFAMLGTPHGPGAGRAPWDPLLRRPFSYYHSYDDGVDFLLRIYGEGTRLLAESIVGEGMHVLGPLGRPFPMPEPGGRVLLVAGGVGLAPFPILLQSLISEDVRDNITMLFGARTAEEVFGLDEFSAAGCTVEIATEDGSNGHEGYVTGLLEAAAPDASTTVYACGPEGLLHAVAAICADRGALCYLSMEARMACGVGACVGCTIVTTGGNKLACREGPVFAGAEVVW